MHVDTMRAIDKWAGIPLTFILTQILRIGKAILPREKRALRRILFIELSEMGSTILADPALQKAKNELSAELFFLIFHKNRGSLELTGTIPTANVCTLREHNIILLCIDTISFCLWVRRNKIDTVVDLELFSRFTALLTGVSGACRRVGFYSFHNEGLYRGELLTHRVAYNPHIHIAKNFIAMINALLTDHEEVPYSKQRIEDSELILPQYRCSHEDITKMHGRIKEYAGGAFKEKEHHLVLINPNASELLPQRRWMVERYEELIKKILNRRPDVLVLITGAPGEQKEADNMCARIEDPRCVNFTGALKLSELPVLYTTAALMVTNDSGPGHFSSITPLPTFVLFGPETPSLYGSLGNSTPLFAGLACSPCVSAANHRKTPCTDNKCLQAITVDQVFTVLTPVLDSLPLIPCD
ncbi:MAG TPA: glycosyltransferase family 9 protein [Desulfobulbaceae bacterium]|nr:glycosyltransferase family 9 protein [Desulfobulbaceae bacterium]